jgi:glutathione S-transferase
MSEFIVYGVPGSPYVRSALLGLEEKGADWRLAPLEFGGHKSAEHLGRHPFGRMPVLEHGDFVLYETQAILRYLDTIIPAPPLTPRAPRAEARMNQICGIADWYVMKDVSASIVFPRLVAPRFGLSVDEAAIAEALPRARVCIGELSRLLGTGAFMAGDRISIADLLLAPQLAFLDETAEGAALLADAPNLAGWIASMNARPSMAATTWERLAALAQAA